MSRYRDRQVPGFYFRCGDSHTQGSRGRTFARSGTIYCLGDIVHNSGEVERLRAKGLVTITRADLEYLKGVKVLPARPRRTAGNLPHGSRASDIPMSSMPHVLSCFPEEIKGFITAAPTEPPDSDGDLW